MKTLSQLDINNRWWIREFKPQQQLEAAKTSLQKKNCTVVTHAIIASCLHSILLTNYSSKWTGTRAGEVNTENGRIT